MSLAATTEFSDEESVCEGQDRVSYLPEAPESFFVSAEEARGQIEDDIECGEVTARSRGAVGPDPSKYCLV